jgi:hypothetical protein
MDRTSGNSKANPEDERGIITRVRGPVVDVEFASGRLPSINDALMIEVDGRAQLVAEIQEHLDLHTVRAVATENTSGLRRGAIARRSGGPISVPVGEKVLGRLINAIGDPIDRLGPIDSGVLHWPIHRNSPAINHQDHKREVFRCGFSKPNPRQAASGALEFYPAMRRRELEAVDFALWRRRRAERHSFSAEGQPVDELDSLAPDRSGRTSTDSTVRLE